MMRLVVDYRDCTSALSEKFANLQSRLMEKNHFESVSVLGMPKAPSKIKEIESVQPADWEDLYEEVLSKLGDDKNITSSSFFILSSYARVRANLNDLLKMHHPNFILVAYDLPNELPFYFGAMQVKTRHLKFFQISHIANQKSILLADARIFESIELRSFFASYHEFQHPTFVRSSPLLFFDAASLDSSKLSLIDSGSLLKSYAFVHDLERSVINFEQGLMFKMNATETRINSVRKLYAARPDSSITLFHSMSQFLTFSWTSTFRSILHTVFVTNMARAVAAFETVQPILERKVHVTLFIEDSQAAFQTSMEALGKKVYDIDGYWVTKVECNDLHFMLLHRNNLQKFPLLVQLIYMRAKLSSLVDEIDNNQSITASPLNPFTRDLLVERFELLAEKKDGKKSTVTASVLDPLVRDSVPSDETISSQANVEQVVKVSENSTMAEKKKRKNNAITVNVDEEKDNDAPNGVNLNVTGIMSSTGQSVRSDDKDAEIDKSISIIEELNEVEVHEVILENNLDSGTVKEEMVKANTVISKFDTPEGWNVIHHKKQKEKNVTNKSVKHHEQISKSKSQANTKSGKRKHSDIKTKPLQFVQKSLKQHSTTDEVEKTTSLNDSSLQQDQLTVESSITAPVCSSVEPTQLLMNETGFGNEVIQCQLVDSCTDRVVCLLPVNVDQEFDSLLSNNSIPHQKVHSDELSDENVESDLFSKKFNTSSTASDSELGCTELDDEASSSESHSDSSDESQLNSGSSVAELPVSSMHCQENNSESDEKSTESHEYVETVNSFETLETESLPVLEPVAIVPVSDSSFAHAAPLPAPVPVVFVPQVIENHHHHYYVKDNFGQWTEVESNPRSDGSISYQQAFSSFACAPDYYSHSPMALQNQVPINNYQPWMSVSASSPRIGSSYQMHPQYQYQQAQTQTALLSNFNQWTSCGSPSSHFGSAYQMHPQYYQAQTRPVPYQPYGLYNQAYVTQSSYQQMYPSASYSPNYFTAPFGPPCTGVAPSNNGARSNLKSRYSKRR